MKKLIITRGAPGSGKSTLIDQLGFRNYAISMDMIRSIFASIEMNLDGSVGLNQSLNRLVFQKFSEILDERMGRGEFLVVDQTTPAKADLDFFKDLAKKHNYELLMVDFSAMPIEQIKKYNLMRAEHKQVPEKAIDRIHELLHTTRLDTSEMTVLPVDFDNLEATKAQIHDWVETPIYDFSDFKEIVHIGDIQGCFTVLTDEDGPFSNDNVDQNKIYIFVGDLLDRGLENGKVLKWFHDVMLPNPNVFLIWGNHEDHLWRWANGVEAVSSEFRDKTLPQLLEEGVTPEMARAVCERAQFVLPYVWRGQKVMVCHAGLSSVPQNFSLISTDQYSRGVGVWNTDVDDLFEKHAPDGWVQVHGHRNGNSKNIIASKNSINLEDRVEFGGALRTAALNEKGWIPSSYKNDVFLEARLREKSKFEEFVGLDRTAPFWMKEEQNITLSSETLTQMRAHTFINTRQSKTFPHVESISFSKQAFFEAAWDDLSTKARGLFINTHTQEIVARGYEKFFNVGERADTTVKSLTENMVFPVRLFLKENGFLGNVGYDSESKKLFIASKSSAEGEFAENFQKIFKEMVPAQKREEIRRWLRDNEASMVFEVIDPKNDPHMIDYAGNDLVLLDIFHRSEKHEKLPFDHLLAIGERFGLKVKENAILVKTPDQFAKLYESITVNLDWKYKGKHLEGFVVEDQMGFQTKIKTPYYSFWKRIRGQIEYLKNNKEIYAPFKNKSEFQEHIQVAKDNANAIKDKRLKMIESGEILVNSSEEIKIRDQLQEAFKEYSALKHREKQALSSFKKDNHPLFQMFMNWADETCSAEKLNNNSILELRSEFMEQVNPSKEILNQTWIGFTEALEEEFDKPDVVVPTAEEEVKAKSPKIKM